jgi:uncharacterized protein
MRADDTSRPLPDGFTLPGLTPFNTEWFTSGTLAIQRCASCQALQHPPEEVCHACGAMEFGHEVMAPRGRVHSFTVVHHAATRALEDSVPYIVVLVSLDDAPQIRVVGNLVGEEAGVASRRPSIGDPVEAVWSSHDPGDGVVIRLPHWRPWI